MKWTGNLTHVERRGIHIRLWWKVQIKRLHKDWRRAQLHEIN
jgi:hypothetical protein